MRFAPTYHGPIWEDDVFGAEIKPLQLTILIFPNQFEEFNLYFSKFNISHVPAK
jgi:hypothetical protein